MSQRRKCGRFLSSWDLKVFTHSRAPYTFLYRLSVLFMPAPLVVFVEISLCAKASEKVICAPQRLTKCLSAPEISVKYNMDSTVARLKHNQQLGMSECMSVCVCVLLLISMPTYGWSDIFLYAQTLVLVQSSLQLTDTLKGGHLQLADRFFFTGRFPVKFSYKTFQKADT